MRVFPKVGCRGNIGVAPTVDTARTPTERIISVLRIGEDGRQAVERIGRFRLGPIFERRASDTLRPYGTQTDVVRFGRGGVLCDNCVVQVNPAFGPASISTPPPYSALFEAIVQFSRFIFP